MSPPAAIYFYDSTFGPQLWTPILYFLLDIFEICTCIEGGDPIPADRRADAGRLAEALRPGALSLSPPFACYKFSIYPTPSLYAIEQTVASMAFC